MRPSIDTELTRRLVDAQFPQWAGLPLARVEPGGSDHVIHRLGTELSVRMPRHPGPLGGLDTEFAWLPRLAPHLPLAVPVPEVRGRPGFGYPWPWSVSRWLDGQTASVEKLGDDTAVAAELADFLSALWDFGRVHRPAPGDAGVPAPQPLAERDRVTRAAIARAADAFDAEAMTAVWDAALKAAPWSRPPVWVHGDFHTGNLLTRDGRLGAVIDFSNLAFGDPATDLMMAYSLMTPPCRDTFRAALGVDADTWSRGRGWGLTGALLAYTAYAHESPAIEAATTRQIRAVLEDWAERG